MIQRIQTVYLAIAAILIMLPVFLGWNLASVPTAAGEYQLTTVAVNLVSDTVTENVLDAFPIAGTMILGLFLTIYAIIQFKNRKFQIKLVQGEMLVQLAVGGVVFFYADKVTSLAESDAISYSPVLTLLAVNVLLYFLAFKGIKKDDELVRSADRLR